MVAIRQFQAKEGLGLRIILDHHPGVVEQHKGEGERIEKMFDDARIFAALRIS